MKTLDEVIKAYEICLNINETSCRDCPYTEFNAEGKWACSLCGDCTEDALHYLKELKEARNIIATAREEAKKQIEDFKADVEYRMAYNPVLTWDELRTMEGKPVWVELLYHHPEQKYKYWDVIKLFDAVEGYDLINLVQTGYLHKSLLNREWQAYRKERE